MGQSKLKAAVTVFKKRTKLYYDHQLLVNFQPNNKMSLLGVMCPHQKCDLLLIRIFHLKNSPRNNLIFWQKECVVVIG